MSYFHHIVYSVNAKENCHLNDNSLLLCLFISYAMIHTTYESLQDELDLDINMLM